MANVPRKLLLVERPDGQGYNVMLEIDNRSKTLQVTKTVGERMMAACQDAILTIAVQAGLGQPGR